MNAAQRLESLGKEVDPEAEAIVLISDAVAGALPPGFELLDEGSHQFKGKAEALRVHRLVGGASQASP